MRETSDIDGEEDHSAEAVIDRTVEQAGKDSVSGAELLRRLEQERLRERVTAASAQRIDEYIAGVRPAVAGAVVEDRPDGVGGDFNGNKKCIATSTFETGGKIEEAVARVQETGAHETYHEENGHTQAMIAGSSATEDVAAFEESMHPGSPEEPEESGTKGADTVVTIGGDEFGDTALIEGLTVAKTGDRFVSGKYRRYKQELLGAVSAAGISIEAVEAAVRKKDLREIDDADRKGPTAKAPSEGMPLAA